MLVVFTLVLIQVEAMFTGLMSHINIDIIDKIVFCQRAAAYVTIFYIKTKELFPDGIQ